MQATLNATPARSAHRQKPPPPAPSSNEQLAHDTGSCSRSRSRVCATVEVLCAASSKAAPLTRPPPSISDHLSISASHHLPPVSLSVCFALPCRASAVWMAHASGKGPTLPLAAGRLARASRRVCAARRGASYLVDSNIVNTQRPCDACAVRSAEAGSSREQHYAADCSCFLQHCSPSCLSSQKTSDVFLCILRKLMRIPQTLLPQIGDATVGLRVGLRLCSRHVSLEVVN